MEKPERKKILDYIKGIAVLFVIITHYHWEADARKNLLFPYWIDMAVPVFMIISGYVASMSYSRKKVMSLNQAYQWKEIIHKIFRYTFPFLIAYGLELIGELYLRGIEGAGKWVFNFFRGGYGPGSYYYPVMIQFVFLFPLVYFLIKKLDFAGVLLCGFGNFFYEILQRLYFVSEGCYRLLIFRYLLLIGFGCYLYCGYTKPKLIVNALSFVLGISFIYLVSYTEYEPKLIIYWTGTSFLAALYVMPLFFMGGGTVDLNIQSNAILYRLLGFMGKASYNIFLVQMVYYQYFVSFIYSLGLGIFMELGINIAVCVVIGSVFYRLENLFIKKTEVLNNFDKIIMELKKQEIVFEKKLTLKK